MLNITATRFSRSLPMAPSKPLSVARLRPAAGVAILGLLASFQAMAGDCENLRAGSLKNVAIVSAAPVAAAAGLPEYCQVKLVAKPVADSEIRIEVWLPPAGQWNGKFVGTGNGGYSGALSYADMRLALARGYATAGSNTGHDGGDLLFGAGHEEKIRDWAYRAVHVMTETAKAVLQEYYARAPEHSYFTGCSTGGHQALMEAQRYPSDYDGIIAGDPGNDRIRLNTGFLWSWLAANKDPSRPFPASKLFVLNRAVIEACDAIDGIKDGLISDPSRCRFDPAELQCKDGDAANCLTPAEVAAVKAIYEGAKSPTSGAQIFPGWAKGSESGWTGYFVGQRQPARSDFWKLWVFGSSDWDPRSFDFDRGVAAAEAEVGFIDATNPDLRPFQSGNGKLLMYHGWADSVVPPEDGIGYYENVAKKMGGAEKIGSFFRLFMAPGMGHCGGGPGPNSFDTLRALDEWVSRGNAPQKIVASHSTNGVVDRTRPLCPYPRVAQWTGSGSSDDAANFVCAAAKPDSGK